MACMVTGITVSGDASAAAGALIVPSPAASESEMVAATSPRMRARWATQSLPRTRRWHGGTERLHGTGTLLAAPRQNPHASGRIVTAATAASQTQTGPVQHRSAVRALPVGPSGQTVRSDQIGSAVALPARLLVTAPEGTRV